MLTDLRTLTPSQRWGLTFKAQLDNALGRVDYPFFVGQILGYHGIANDPNNPGNFEQFNDPRVQENMAAVGGYFKNWMDTRHLQGSFKKVMQIQPRGTAKSAICTIPLPIWAHLHDSEIACAVIGAKHKDIAEQFSKATRLTFQGEDPNSRLVDLYGRFKGGTAGRDWQVSQMTTAKRKNLGRSDPTYAAYSIAKGATSSHFDLLIMDDPVTREAMEGDSEWLEKVWAAYVRLPYLINRNGLFILIMTRYHDSDLCGRIIREEIEPAVLEAHGGQLPEDWDYEDGWIKYAHHAGWEVRYDAVYENYDKETGTGDVVYPICWSHEKIKHSRQTAAGEAEFWYHLMNAPQKRTDQPVTEEHVKRCFIESLDEVPPAALNCVDIHADFSFKNEEAFRKQTGDWGVAHVVAKHLGHVYRLGGFRAKLKQVDFGRELVELARMVKNDLKANVRYISFDQPQTHGSGDESTNQWIYEIFRTAGISGITPKPLNRKRGAGSKKIARILDTVWAWQQGYVHLLRGVGNTDPLVYQIVNLGYTTYDDDIDAFSDAFHPSMYMAAPIFMEDENETPWEQQWRPAYQPIGTDFDDEDW
jgi:hypothetical protein